MFVNIFSQYIVVCLFILLLVYFKDQKFSVLLKSDLSVFSFMVIAFCVLFEEPLPISKCWRFLLCFHLKGLQF